MRKVFLYPLTLLTCFLWTLLISSCASTSQEPRVTSPDGRIALALQVDPQDGSLSYEISIDNNPFILPSALGFEAMDSINLSTDFRITHVDFDRKDETWTQPWGENKTLRNHYHEMAVSLTNARQVALILRFRLFDDGLGFRYEYRVPQADSLRLTNELTQFRFAADGRSWSIPASFETYELDYRELPLSGVETANTPITFRIGKTWGSIHEAALTDFPEMTLKQHTESAAEQRDTTACFTADLAPWPDGIKARFTGDSFTSPWRTIQIGDEAVDLINSALILNLNEPCKLETTDWIRPMKYVGVWWGMHLGVEGWGINDRHGATTENAKRYIDFAAANNIEGVLFEGWNEGWESWGGRQNFDYTRPYADFDMDEIVRYAKEKNIRLIGHHETGGNIANYERQLDKSYKWYADYGVHSVKTGYAGGLPDGHNHHGQFNVRHYRRVVETAARYHTTINAHEPIKDTGIRRTYPNMMTREGARGMEWNAWSDGNRPRHHVTLPFTRLLGGPMDYTPGIFDLTYERAKKNPLRRQWNMKDSKDCRIHTTLAKQIALWVILYSPLQMASDMIENYEGHPAFQFFRDYEADIDWSQTLCGEPGQSVVTARRAGEKYFLGAATGDDPCTVTVPLDFLKAGQKYRAIIYADAPETDLVTNPGAYRIEEREVTAEDKLEIVMAAGGGQAVTFLPL